MSDGTLIANLRLPYDIAMDTITGRSGYWYHGQEAAIRIEALRTEVHELARALGKERAEVARLRAALEDKR